MKERGILFSGEMVRAILDGRKTQTRRVVKLPAGYEVEGIVRASQEKSHIGRLCLMHVEDRQTLYRPCPYGGVGDRLWVRETFATAANWDDTPISKLPRDISIVRRSLNQSGGKWRSPIHMPRWASRITLEITGVRVERLQDITEGDAVVEGRARHNKPPESISTVEMFAASWNGLNEKRGYGWDVNPWVWVIEFKRMEA